MKFLIDMNLSPSWVRFFASNGIDAIHWSTVGAPGAEDTVLLSWAKKEGRALFTHDMDFAALIALAGLDGPSVLQVRTQDVLPDAFACALAASLLAYSQQAQRGIEDERIAFHETLREAQQEYDAVVRKSSDRFKEKLRAAVAVETKAGNLDKAVALRGEADALEKPGPPLFGNATDLPLSLATIVPGTWDVAYYPNHWRRRYVIQPNGEVSCEAEKLKGKIARKADSLVLDFGDGKLERLTFAGRRLFIEHYIPKDSYPTEPNQVGIGDATSLK
jgi:predicted nuclease of predicted toxin-antitoxin system